MLLARDQETSAIGVTTMAKEFFSGMASMADLPTEALNGSLASTFWGAQTGFTPGRICAAPIKCGPTRNQQTPRQKQHALRAMTWAKRWKASISPAKII
jgi:hypothetical protein